MKLYLLSQKKNNDRYEYFDSVLVAPHDEHSAKRIHPNGGTIYFDAFKGRSLTNDGWPTKASEIECEYIGKAKKGMDPGVIISSFNAG